MTTGHVTVVFCRSASDCYRQVVPILTQHLTLFELLITLAEGDFAVQAQLDQPIDQYRVGVFSHRVKDPQTYLLVDGDRVELYRPLTIDPMSVRRARAAKFPVGKVKRINGKLIT